MVAAVPDAPRASVLPGLAIAGAIALGARFSSELAGTVVFNLGRSPVSPIMLAVLAGVVIRNTVGLAPRLEPGLALATGVLLRIGLALIGLRLTLASVGTLGLQALPVVAGCLGFAWLVIPRLARGLGLEGALVILLTVGTSICGCTAVMAVAPIVRARAAEIGYAITLVVVIGLGGALLYPALAHGLFGGDPAAAGTFLGTAIHDTSQVMGAALIYSDQYLAPEALESATVAKLLRNLALVVVVPALVVLQARTVHDPGGSRLPPLRRLVPGFVVAFLALAALRTLGDALSGTSPQFANQAWRPGLNIAGQLCELLLTTGMAAVGLTVELRDLRRVGWRPLAAGILAAALLASVSAALVAALF